MHRRGFGNLNVDSLKVDSVVLDQGAIQINGPRNTALHTSKIKSLVMRYP